MSYGDDDASRQQSVNDGTDGRPAVRHLEVTPDQAGQRLDNFVHRELGDLPRSPHLPGGIRKGEVRVNGHRGRARHAAAGA